MSVRDLYGGAIRAVLPGSFADVSSLREVPDHQEVFLDEVTESSLIVELLDMEVAVDGEAAIRQHFADLARDNESSDTSVQGEVVRFAGNLSPNLDQSFERLGLIGTQVIKKYRSESSPQDTVIIVMVLLRLASVTTDVLITLNIPVPPTFRQNIAAFEDLQRNLSPVALLPGDDVADMHRRLLVSLPMLDSLRVFLNSFQVVNWGLFGG